MSQNILWITFFVIILNSEYVKADYCGDDTTRDCYEEKCIPMAIAATVLGVLFSVAIMGLTLCLFCKARKRVKANRRLIYVTQKEPSNWVREVQDSVNGNRVRGLGDRKPEQVIFKDDTYSERETAIPATPTSSDIMDAIDAIEEPEQQPPGRSSSYYWAPDKQKVSNVEYYNNKDMKRDISNGNHGMSNMGKYEDNFAYHKD